MSRSSALAALPPALAFCAAAAGFFYLHFVTMAPKSTDPDYYCVYWLERALYYAGSCDKAELSLDAAVPGLIECREDPWLRFINKLNGLSLRVDKPPKIVERWLPTGERVFVDQSNDFVFWSKNGKVTNFVKLDQELLSMLLDMPPGQRPAGQGPEGTQPSSGGGAP
ncbi:MAG: hypothetical protein LJE95_02480 [Acidobacteria bacterium]|jgi:hypothetical protein|nr:hypothetical protein [Acidobacteriota bacterium]